MIAPDLTPEQMKKEIRKMRKEMIQVGAEIRDYLRETGREGAQAPLVAIRKFEQMKVPYVFTRKGQELFTEQEIVDLYRDLKYVTGLKTATLEGAKQSLENFEPINVYLSALEEEEQETFWNIYDKIYEDLQSKYKYEIMETISALQTADMSPQQIEKRIKKAYTDILEGKRGKDISDEQLELRFTRKLERLREKYSFYMP